MKPIISGVPAASTTLMQRSTRFEASATGFSQNTALPALAPASIRSACVSVGVPIRIASMSPAAMIALASRTSAPVALASLRRRALVDVGERDQGRVGRGRDVLAMDLADAPGAEQTETKHVIPPLAGSHELVRPFRRMIGCRQEANNGSREEWLKATQT